MFYNQLSLTKEQDIQNGWKKLWKEKWKELEISL